MRRERLRWPQRWTRARETTPAFAALGDGSRFDPPILLMINPESMRIGARVHIRPFAQFEALCDPGDVRLTIGDGTYIGAFARITAVGGVHIGNNCLFADRVYVSDTGHAYEDPDVPILKQPSDRADGWRSLTAPGSVSGPRSSAMCASAATRSWARTRW